LNLKLIAKETQKDPYLSEVYNCIKNGWKIDRIEPKNKLFFQKNPLLSIEQGFISCNSRVVIRDALKTVTLILLHSNHKGIVKMKQLARSYVFWERMDSDIENFVKSYHACQSMQNDNRRKDCRQWPSVSYPFERVHLDFFHFRGKQFLILIDCFTRWIKVKKNENNYS
jgi:Integrase zinc binding domain